jgi:hypothetical protein
VPPSREAGKGNKVIEVSNVVFTLHDLRRTFATVG